MSTKDNNESIIKNDNSSVKSSRDEDFKDPVQIAFKSGASLRQISLAKNEVNINVVTRSQFVAISRINKDKPCDFGEEVKVNADVFRQVDVVMFLQEEQGCSETE
ncbi:hypothetical protein HAX54_050004 [Datura stramonium]|uniref:Uncharacterized protein n=1 Tax=Datura stramonium TaxID=4076 RepID=A0ABS8WKY8_DATST|nr:hypothetical protein [Datura stramonium]